MGLTGCSLLSVRSCFIKGISGNSWFIGYNSNLFFQEGGGLNTWENANNSYAILRQNGWTGLYAVTDMIHSRRAVACLRAAGVSDVRFWPTGSGPAAVIDAADFLPTVSGLSRWRIMSYEISAVAYYVMVGRIEFSDIF